MKFECNWCEFSTPCVLNGHGQPSHCPFSKTMNTMWREVTEPAALPKMTAEDSKPQLPDWVKVGAWVYDAIFGVGKVANPQLNSDTALVDWAWSGDRSGVLHKNLKPVTFRAWTANEAELQVGKAFRFKKTGYIGAMLGFHKEYGVAFPASGEHHNVYFSSLDELFEQGEQLSGLPCGVPQVDGEDLEG